MLSPNLSAALLITAIGMGLVFAAIILLWGVMAAIVRLLPESAAPAAAEEDASADDAAEAVELGLRQQAAAAAVAVALADQRPAGRPPQFGVPASAIVSAWQAVQRSRLLNRRGMR